MDPLSSVLSLLQPRSYTFGGFCNGGDWSVKFGPYTGIKCYALVSGHCWLSVQEVAAPVHLEAGNSFLLPAGRPFRLASDLALTPVDVSAFFHLPVNGALQSINGGGEFSAVGGHFDFAGKHAEILLGVLPPIVHLRKKSDKAAMRWSIEQMMDELRNPQAGSFLITQQLATMMMIRALRLYLAEGVAGGVGWFYALADKQMGIAITSMHDAPGHLWTVQELAELVGMSRASFALRFRCKVGVSPIEYLTRWRMLLAADRLRKRDDALSAITQSLGYESESAFSTAFKRIMGSSPRNTAEIMLKSPKLLGS